MGHQKNMKFCKKNKYIIYKTKRSENIMKKVKINILFLTLIDFKTTNDYGIYYDFINELKKYSNKIVVVSPNERRNNNNTTIIKEENVDILKVKTGNITKTNKIEKGISTLFIERNFQKAINRYYK
ncbi:hypothetical protein BUZ92_13725, partial [Mammaliicoccus sciuri]